MRSVKFIWTIWFKSIYKNLYYKNKSHSILYSYLKRRVWINVEFQYNPPPDSVYTDTKKQIFDKSGNSSFAIPEQLFVAWFLREISK